MEKCSFCGKDFKHVTGMIQSPCSQAYICGSCASIAAKTLGSGQNAAGCRQNAPKTAFDLTPGGMHRELDRFIIGQEKAKKILSVAVYNHAKRLSDRTGLIKKSNILLAGPSGSGKTLLARTLAKILDVPFVITDATSLTEAGYVGDDVEICLQRLMQAAGGDIGLAQKGIVYIDEIDKTARKGGHRSITRDVSGEGVQESLLKLIEGCEVSVPIHENRKHPHKENVLFNTENVLFICGGAFAGMLEAAAESSPIGFLPLSSKSTGGKPALTPEALVKYGMIPELVGRLPILCLLDGLQEDDLVRILTEPEDAVTKEYQLLLKKDGVELMFEDDALREIAKAAAAQKTGARGLRAILDEVLLNAMYSIPDIKEGISKCIITKDSIRTKQPAIVQKRMGKKASAPPAP